MTRFTLGADGRLYDETGAVAKLHRDSKGNLMRFVDPQFKNREEAEAWLRAYNIPGIVEDR